MAVFTNPRTAHLVEMTGHTGPWTSEEWNDAFYDAEVVPPNVPPRPDPPADVLEAADQLDAATIAYDVASRRRSELIIELRDLHRKAGDSLTMDARTGMPSINKKAVRKAKALEAELADALRDVEDAEVVLRRAKAAAYKTRRRWLAGLRHAEYERTKKG